jgi:putative hydrolase of the HAD superfamily
VSGSDPVWLFDLDNTLHDATPHIFPRINRAMTDYIMRELSVDEPQANALRQRYWSRYGATLRGLVAHHGIDPGHFLWHTHQFPDLDSILIHDRALKFLLPRLPGRKVLFSNAPEHYAKAVLARIGIGRCFDAVYAIEHLRLRPKPEVSAYLRLLSDLRIPASRCIMVEDSADNLVTAKRLGMRTVWVSTCTRRPPCVDFVVRHIGDLYRRNWRR